MNKCVSLVFMLGLFSIAQAQVITTGNGTGSIPDVDPSGLVVTFPVSGLTAPIDSVSITVTMDHTFVGDLKVSLQAPDGIARIILFDTTGYKRSALSGNSVNLNGSYTFNDMADDDWWATATGQNTGFTMPSGSYRSSTTGTVGSFSDFGGCTTRMDGAFNGLSPEQANGTWVLTVVDQFSGDQGNVISAIMTLNEQSNVDLIFKDGFEAIQFDDFTTFPASGLLGDCKKTRFDFTGNGLADFAIAEDNGNSEILWTIQDNDTTTVGAIQSFILGAPATDFLMEGDIDGDGIKDPIVWRSAPDGEQAYYVRRSSRPNDNVLKFVMGQTGDVAGQIGDYDGDGIEDFAVFRAPSGAVGPTKLIIHESSNGNFREIDMISGTNTTVFSTSGYDYTGDSIADAIIQRTSPDNAGVGQHLIYDGSNGDLFDTFEFGNNTDLLAPGNYSGNDRADINLARSVAGNRDWYTRETGPGTETGPTTFGDLPGFVLTGDYDGDGYDDYAVYETNSNELKFKIRPSSNPGTIIEVPIGSTGIYPIPNSRVQ